MDHKQLAAEAAVEIVEDGMLLGLGTGSTAEYFIAGLGRRVAEGLRVNCVATSNASRYQAEALGIAVSDRADRRLDLTVDGADEVDPELTLVKGLGGALLREKIVATSSERMVVIVTEEKLVQRLGTRSPLPVEVLPLLWELTAEEIRRLGLKPALRVAAGDATSAPFITDNGNLVLDCRLPEVVVATELSAALDAIPGVMGHGLFVGIASRVIVAGAGGVRVLERA